MSDTTVVINPDVEKALDSWVEQLTEPGGKRGLWVFGPRKSGSTTVVKFMYRKHRDAFPEYQQKRTAAKLDRQVRRQWKSDALLRANGGDFPLWLENSEIEDELETFWGADAIWINDLYSEFDAAFVRKNLFLPMDEALKRGAIVIVTSSLPPDYYGDEWATVITSTFKTVELSVAGR
jgi:hypothetical protein